MGARDTGGFGRSVVAMARLASLLLLVALAGATLAVATAGAGRPAASGAAAQTSLVINQTGSVAGPISYELTCDPAGGTLPGPSHACAALSTDQSLLAPVPAGLAFPCPFGQSSFQITGRRDGRSVDVGFAACTQGQGPIASRWHALVPSAAARLTVAPGRGVGLWRLGTRESRIRAALGAGHPAGAPCANCRRTYTTGAQVAEVDNQLFRVAIAITYRARRAIRIETNDPATVIAGTRLDAGASALRRRLRSWRRVDCPSGTTQLERGTGPSTIVELGAFVTRLVVQRQPPACG
jgi:hypothetical protein